MAEAFLQAEVRQVVRADFIAQERGELLVLFDESVLPVRPENVMAVLNLLQRSVELALQLLRDATAKDLGDFVGRHPPESHLAGALEDLVDGETSPEDKVPAILYLVQGVEPAQVHGRSLAFREVGPEPQRPVVKAFLDHAGSETVGSLL